MFQWFMKRMKKDNKGFTLVELVVVIAILGVLSAIAIPKLGASRKNAAITAHNSNVRTLMSAATMYIADDGDIPVEDEDAWTGTGGTKGTDTDAWEPYLQEWPKVPKGLSNVREEDPIEGDYEVEIDEEGNITVTPGEYRELEESEES